MGDTASNKLSIGEEFSYKTYYTSSDGTIMRKVHDLARILQFAEEAGFNTLRRPLVTSSANRVRIRDRISNQLQDMVMFGSNNYLGLTTDPRVIQAAKDAIEEFGVGASGPPLLNGTHQLQDLLESRIAKLKGYEDAVLFSSGYASNVGCVSGLMRADDLIVNDRLAHASIIDGCRLSGARFVTFNHNSAEALDRKLTKMSAYRGRTMVALDGVYSMDGDTARLDQIVPVVKAHDALLMIDDAHATGVIGKNGMGTKSHYDLDEGVDIVVGTLGKAVGAVGGFVAASKEISDYLRIYARSSMYSTALPPAVCAAAAEAIRIIEEEPELIEQLWRNINYVKTNLDRLGFDTGNSESAIIPVLIRDEGKLILMQKEIHDNGVFIGAVSTPVVPQNQSRFRISMMSTHTAADMDRLLNVMESIGKKYQVI